MCTGTVQGIILCAAGAVMCAEGRNLADCVLSSRACCRGTAQQVDTKTSDSHSVLTTRPSDLSLVGKQPKQRTPSHANFKVSLPQPAGSMTLPASMQTPSPASESPSPPGRQHRGSTTSAHSNRCKGPLAGCTQDEKGQHRQSGAALSVPMGPALAAPLQAVPRCGLFGKHTGR